MKAEETIRVGVVGAGGNTRARHIPGLQAINGVEVVSVANRSRASSECVARELGIPTVYESWEELVAADDTNAIVIGTWPYLHCPATLAALEAGKHVMCEARMACDAAEASTMLEASRKHPELVTQVVPSPFTLTVDNTIRRLVTDGYLGELLAIEVHAMGGTYIDRDAPLQWRQDRELSGLNVMNLGIWYEALMRWVGEAVRVMAKGKVCVSERVDPETGTSKTIEIPDHLVVTADMACGAQALFRLSSVAGATPSSDAYLYGSEATLHITPTQLFGAPRDTGEFSEIPVLPEEAGEWRVEEEFVEAIRGVAPIRLTTFETGARYMAFTEAVHRSMEEKSEVAVP